MSGRAIPELIGVIHLQPLPGSPGYDGRLEMAVAAAARDAAHLAEAGFEGIIVENFGDAPFCAGRVEPETIAAMTRCALAVRDAAADLPLGINVLRNDALAALAVAMASYASMIRVNIHMGARVTDQGVIEGDAYATLRKRRQLGLEERVQILCDVDVKHSAPLAPRPLAEEAVETVERGLADAILITGAATGRAADPNAVAAVAVAVDVPVLLASGVTPDNLDSAAGAAGVIVGSWLRADGRAGGAIDPDRAKRFAEAYREMRGR